MKRVGSRWWYPLCMVLFSFLFEGEVLFISYIRRVPLRVQAYKSFSQPLRHHTTSRLSRLGSLPRITNCFYSGGIFHPRSVVVKTSSTALFSQMNESKISTHRHDNHQLVAQQPYRIAVIGAGAAGLVATRVLTREVPHCHVTVLEQREGLGGVWRYSPTKSIRLSPASQLPKTRTDHSNNHAGELPNRPEKQYHPMYRGLRTNLPKEIMAYREFPWTDECMGPGSSPKESYPTHQQVLEYLQSYAKRFHLESYIQFNAHVQSIQLDETALSAFQPPGETWPRVRVKWTVSKQRDSDDDQPKSTRLNDLSEEIFDAVCICNGHYSKPVIPDIPGCQEYFAGSVVHSVQYDDPTLFRNQTVLCVGGRASGADIARELVSKGNARHVYLSDTSRTTPEPVTHNNVTWVPPTVQVLPNGAIRFGCQCPITPTVDTIIFCTGYDYDFPFLSSETDHLLSDSSDTLTPLSICADQRRVMPVWEQFWHARYPHVCFTGLPHSILPFPLFEFQMEAFAKQLQQFTLPPLSERLFDSKREATSGGEGRHPNGRVPADTHYLGNAQWNYCHRMLRYSTNQEELRQSILDYLATNQVCHCRLNRELLLMLLTCSCPMP